LEQEVAVKKIRKPRDELRGINRLVMAGIAGVVDLVEAMHYNIARIPGLAATSERDRTQGITVWFTGVSGA
jgi:hypothetical protein